MKVLRVLGSIIIGIIIFVLIFATILTSKATTFITGDALRETIKGAIDEVEKNDNNLSDSQKKVIDDMFGDNEASSIINMVLDNYKEYKDNPSYSVSKEDAKKLYDFIAKYRDRIKKLSDQDVSKMSDKEFEDFFDQEKIDEFAKNSFKEFDKNLDEKTIDIALKSYSIATSTSMKVLLIFVIIIFIGLLCLINWSLIKWMIVVGVDFIISGLLFIGLFSALNIVKEELLKEAFKGKVDLDFSTFLISGIIQIVVGIILIVVYSILKKKVFNKKDNVIPQNVEIK